MWQSHYCSYWFASGECFQVNREGIHLSIYLFSSISTSAGSVNLIFLPRKCLCEDSILIINATTFFIPRKGTKPFPIEPVCEIFDGCDISDKEDDAFKQLSTSQEEPSKQFLLITRSSSINGQSVVLRILGPLSQLLFLRASEEIPRVPVSAGLSPLKTRCHSSKMVDSWILTTR